MYSSTPIVQSDDFSTCKTLRIIGFWIDTVDTLNNGIGYGVWQDVCLFWNEKMFFSVFLQFTHRGTKVKWQKIFNFFVLLYRILVNEVNMDPSFHLEYRGPVAMKGKPEPMKCWFLTRNNGFAAPVTPSFEDYPSTST